MLGNSVVEIRHPRTGSASDIGIRLLFGFSVLTAAVLGATLYAVGMRVENFQWETFRSGSLLFVALLGSAAVGILLITMVIRGVAFVSPQSIRLASEKLRLRRTRRRALSAIHRRHQLQEEHARLTAEMQALFLFEKESAEVAGTRSVREFQKALQSGAVRSCEIVFDHLNRMVDQYQRLVEEINQSSLETSEKSDLLDQLVRQLDVPGVAHTNRSAQKMMEDAIWRVRFRKIRLLHRRNPTAAGQYLQSLRKKGASHRMLVQLDALQKELK
jgi:hypothetical protein